jgi:hypothetical protein
MQRPHVRVASPFPDQSGSPEDPKLTSAPNTATLTERPQVQKRQARLTQPKPAPHEAPMRLPLSFVSLLALLALAILWQKPSGTPLSSHEDELMDAVHVDTHDDEQSHTVRKLALLW